MFALQRESLARPHLCVRKDRYPSGSTEVGRDVYREDGDAHNRICKFEVKVKAHRFLDSVDHDLPSLILLCVMSKARSSSGLNPALPRRIQFLSH